MKHRVERYDLPLTRPIVTARGTIEARSGAIVEVIDDDGHVGHGDAAPLPGFSEETLIDVLAALHAWRPGTPFAGPPSAAHAIEQALLDIEAQSRGIHMARVLTPEPRPSVPLHRLVRDADEAIAARDLGFGTLKIKVGIRLPVTRDVELVTSIRQAVGSDVQLRLDANQGWSRAHAEEALRALAPLGIEFIEEPVAGGDPAVLAALRSHMPIAVDESVRSPGELAAAIDAGAADVLVLKPMFVGGPRAAMRLARQARRGGVEVVVTTTLESVVGRRLALHVAAALGGPRSAGLDTGHMLASDLGPDLRIEDGHAWL